MSLSCPTTPQSWFTPFYVHFIKPRFQTYGEFVAFFEQICEVWITFFSPGSLSLSPLGCPIYASEPCRASVNFPSVDFIRLLNVAIRDCTLENIMLDPSGMYPKSFHPTSIKRNKDFRGKAKAHTRTWRPPRYLLIDFGLSRQYDPATGPPLEMPLRGGDKSAPEHRDMETPCDPFPTDVYYLGNLVREDFIQVCIPNSLSKNDISELSEIRSTMVLNSFNH